MEEVKLFDASSEMVSPGFNTEHQKAVASNISGACSLPEVTFADGSDSLDYPVKRMGQNSFALGVDRLHLRNDSIYELGEKFEGVADGLSTTVAEQLRVLASDSNAVNKSLMQMSGSLETAVNYCHEKMSNDWDGFAKSVGAVGAAIKQSSDAYDQATPKQQGEIIGAAMAMFLPIPAIAQENQIAAESILAERLTTASGDLIEGAESDAEKMPFLEFAEHLGTCSKNLDHREKAYMKEKSISIRGVDNIQQVDPDVPESTLGFCGTTADGRTQIIISRQVAEKDIAYVLRHEFGHAFDQTYLDGERISSLPGFKAAFEKDIANLTAHDRTVLEYYATNTVKGRREALASLYAQSMEVATDIDREILLKEMLPNSYNWVKTLVEAFKYEQI